MQVPSIVIKLYNGRTNILQCNGKYVTYYILNVFGTVIVTDELVGQYILSFSIFPLNCVGQCFLFFIFERAFESLNCLGVWSVSLNPQLFASFKLSLYHQRIYWWLNLLRLIIDPLSRMNTSTPFRVEQGRGFSSFFRN